MQKNLLEYLEKTVLHASSHVAFEDDITSVSWGEVYDKARKIGSFLAKKGYNKEPIVVFMEKNPEAIISFLGVVYSGCYYVPIDPSLPAYRISMMIEKVTPRVILLKKETTDLSYLSFSSAFYAYDEMIEFPEDSSLLQAIRNNALATDPLYIIFTSSSTGKPKGVLTSHQAVISYLDSLSEIMGLGPESIFGNQAPLCFDACLKEIYTAMKFGATACLIPPSLFSMPGKLTDFLNHHKVNTICFVSSVLSFFAILDGFRDKKPEYLHTIAFGSEILPSVHLSYWQQHFKHATFLHLYGPTEATGMSCYYPVTRTFQAEESIPIGHPFPDVDILLLDEEKNPVNLETPGEIYIVSDRLALGYYREENLTSQSFFRTPTWYQKDGNMYRTGDIGLCRRDGTLMFLGRRDNQIKHMGYRIDLTEIEQYAAAFPNSGVCAALYLNNRIVLFYTGSATSSELMSYLKTRLPRYMLPSRLIYQKELPKLLNGKLDRKSLELEYK